MHHFPSTTNTAKSGLRLMPLLKDLEAQHTEQVLGQCVLMIGGGLGIGSLSEHLPFPPLSKWFATSSIPPFPNDLQRPVISPFGEVTHISLLNTGYIIPGLTSSLLPSTAPLTGGYTKSRSPQTPIPTSSFQKYNTDPQPPHKVNSHSEKQFFREWRVTM